MKRYRRRFPKPGELTLYYGKLPHDSPDFIFDWGDGCAKSDGRLLSLFLFEQKFDGKNLIEELEARGYDTKSIRFSIKKK